MNIYGLYFTDLCFNSTELKSPTILPYSIPLFMDFFTYLREKVHILCEKRTRKNVHNLDLKFAIFFTFFAGLFFFFSVRGSQFMNDEPSLLFHCEFLLLLYNNGLSLLLNYFRHAHDKNKHKGCAERDKNNT